MNVRRTICAVALAAVSAVGYGREKVVVGEGAVLQGSLDLREAWEITDADLIDVPYSSVGWDVLENGNSATVTLELAPQDGGGAAIVVASGLAGRGTNRWDVSGVANQSYVLRHLVLRSGQTVEPIETLQACLIFNRTSAVLLKTVEAVAAAVFSDDGRNGRPCAIAGMSGGFWEAFGLDGEGIVSPASETATLTFSVESIGTFAFDYVRADGGELTVAVDGGEPQTMDAAADWTAAEFSIGVSGVHAVTVSATGGAAIRGVRWNGKNRFGTGAGGEAPADLREGVLVVGRAAELLPFAWSSTNFTGSALVEDVGFESIDPASVASVRVVRLTGDGDDVASWTAEAAGTEKVLVAERPGEATVVWKGVTRGVWKAELAIRAGGAVVHAETRVLDLRRYRGPGTVILLK